ncbi:MRAS2 [Culex quinquefasciatus]|uniref:small monomeric GTPase n=1 Tax=Culex quinquefasciatus TaxID=7176 RepID=B0WWL6_CULQU|nr:MRAS2 [Culex quinquefasciatus]|eukprot:XP_001861788.1 MRAS2 [Culex quinquefasciatus]
MPVVPVWWILSQSCHRPCRGVAIYGAQWHWNLNGQLSTDSVVALPTGHDGWCRDHALTVRYLTRRFIGEYRSNTDLLYKQTVTLDSGVLDVEIVDISAENGDDFPVEQIQWADACLVVYSITDRTSYEYAQRSLAELRQLQNSPSAYLIGNKADLDHLRERAHLGFAAMKLTRFELQSPSVKCFNAET